MKTSGLLYAMQVKESVQDGGYGPWGLLIENS